jgi:GntR family transcriptional regulator/MocR family aminotransferase
LKTTSSAELLLSIDRASSIPLHVQLEREMRRAVRTGRLPANLPLPSTRALAADLGLSRGVVVECYEQLIAEGYFTSMRGSRTRVATIRTESVQPRAAAPSAGEPRYDFRPGTPDGASFPRRAWFAIREDELAASCMGLNAAQVKLSAFALGAALAGLAGSRATVGNRLRRPQRLAQGIDR